MSVSSMTGFASVETERFRVDVRSVNHRFLDCRVRIPRDLAGAEPALRAKIAEKLARGSVDVTVTRAKTAAVSQIGSGQVSLAGGRIRVDETGAVEAKKFLDQLAYKLGTEPPRLEDILRLPGMVQDMTKPSASLEVGAGDPSSAEALTPAEAWATIEPSISTALDQLVAARRVEGEKTAQALKGFLSELRQGHSRVAGLREAWKTQIREKIRERVKQTLETISGVEPFGSPAWEARVTAEIALVTDRTDIAEELQRLGSHFEAFERELLAANPRQVGKKLEFIAQEIHREWTTLGNKCQDFAIGEIVIHSKTVLEQAREQILNLE